MKEFSKDLKGGLGHIFNLNNTVKEFNELSNKFKGYFGILTISLIGYFIFVGDYSFWGWLAFSGLMFSSINLVLVDNAKLTQFLWGTLTAVTAVIGAYHFKMVGDFVYYLYVFPFQLIGISEGYKLLNTTQEEPISKKLTLNQTFKYSLLGLVAYVVMYFVSVLAGGYVPFVDSGILALGIVGQTLMSNYYREQWVVWIMQNIVAIVAWSIRLNIAITNGENTTFAMAMIILWGIMLVNAFIGAYQWYKLSNTK